MKTSTRRNYGVDLLRIVSMFFVVQLHVLGAGGVLAHGGGGTVAWILETIAYCAVDCYGLISGFVSYRDEDAPCRYEKYVSFWASVVTYSFGITLLVFLLKPGTVPIGDLAKSLLPVTTGAYWYVTAYTGLFFLEPWLNKLMRSLTKAEANFFAATIIAVYVLYSRLVGVLNANVFSFNDGYTFLWLTLLYLLGAWMKKNKIAKLLRPMVWVTMFMCATAITVFAYLKLPNGGLLLNYTSPTIVINAVALLAIFSALQISTNAERIVHFFAPAAFGVYLCHSQAHIWNHFIVDKFIWLTGLPQMMLLLYVPVCTAAILLICLMVEKVRLGLFNLLKINTLLHLIEGLLRAIEDKYVCGRKCQ